MEKADWTAVLSVSKSCFSFLCFLKKLNRWPDWRLWAMRFICAVLCSMCRVSTALAWSIGTVRVVHSLSHSDCIHYNTYFFPHVWPRGLTQFKVYHMLSFLAPHLCKFIELRKQTSFKYLYTVGSGQADVARLKSDQADNFTEPMTQHISNICTQYKWTGTRCWLKGKLDQANNFSLTSAPVGKETKINISFTLCLSIVVCGDDFRRYHRNKIHYRRPKG